MFRRELAVISYAVFNWAFGKNDDSELSNASLSRGTSVHMVYASQVFAWEAQCFLESASCLAVKKCKCFSLHRVLDSWVPHSRFLNPNEPSHPMSRLLMEMGDMVCLTFAPIS